jgi:hypothetical protein
MLLILSPAMLANETDLPDPTDGGDPVVGDDPAVGTSDMAEELGIRKRGLGRRLGNTVNGEDGDGHSHGDGFLPDHAHGAGLAPGHAHGHDEGGDDEGADEDEDGDETPIGN